jgi:putative PIN family toxin of toxin-antitoxin system
MVPADAGTAALRNIVLDTNIVLDLLVFHDPAAAALDQALQSGQWRWLATAGMREELARVLAYPKIVPRLATCELTANQVLAQFDARAQTVDAAARAQVSCTDADDQPFIDLAVAHKSWLMSKDRAVLVMRKRLLALGVVVQSAVEFAA